MLACDVASLASYVVALWHVYMHSWSGVGGISVAIGSAPAMKAILCKYTIALSYL